MLTLENVWVCGVAQSPEDTVGPADTDIYKCSTFAKTVFGGGMAASAVCPKHWFPVHYIDKKLILTWQSCEITGHLAFLHF